MKWVFFVMMILGPFLINLTNNYSIIIQGLPHDRNVGFFFVIPDKLTKSLWDNVSKLLLSNENLFDQHTFNLEVNKAIQTSKLSVLVLSTKEYPFETFFFSYPPKIDGVKIAYIVGLDRPFIKSYGIKEYALGGKLLQNTAMQQLFTYINKWKNPIYQRSELKQSLNYSLFTNLTLILPSFYCDHIKFYNIIIII